MRSGAKLLVYRSIYIYIYIAESQAHFQLCISHMIWIYVLQLIPPFYSAHSFPSFSVHYLSSHLQHINAIFTCKYCSFFALLTYLFIYRTNCFCIVDVDSIHVMSYSINYHTFTRNIVKKKKIIEDYVKKKRPINLKE